MMVITCEGWAGELGRQDGGGHVGEGGDLLPDGQHVLVAPVESRAGVRDTRLLMMPRSIVERLARALAAHLRLRERLRRLRREPQGVAAPHLEESLGKAAVRAGVKGAKERCGLWETVPFVKCDEGGPRWRIPATTKSSLYCTLWAAAVTSQLSRDWWKVVGHSVESLSCCGLSLAPSRRSGLACQLEVAISSTCETVAFAACIGPGARCGATNLVTGTHIMMSESDAHWKEFLAHCPVRTVCLLPLLSSLPCPLLVSQNILSPSTQSTLLSSLFPPPSSLLPSPSRVMRPSDA
eukprot:1477638-Rhodomonas_salina.1